jgi:hypothetical protein
MELKAFLAELVMSLARLDFVASLDLRTEVFTVKGRVHLTQRGFLEVYFNERTQTVAVAWIEAERRRWGIDRDNLRGWHRHPLDHARQQNGSAPILGNQRPLKPPRRLDGGAGKL